MEKTPTTVILSSTPYSKKTYQGLLIAISSLALQTPTSIIFIGDGVYCTKRKLESNEMAFPNIARLIREALRRGCQVYVHEESLNKRELKRADIIPRLNLIDVNKLLDLMSVSIVYSF